MNVLWDYALPLSLFSCAPVSNIGTPNTTVPRHTSEGGGGGAKTTANGGKTKKKRKVSARELVGGPGYN